MINPMYPIILDEMGRVLKLSKRELEPDIRSIAEHWESCLEKGYVVDRDAAIFYLTTCVTCYLRGRGIRFGNYKMLKKNNGILVSMVTLVSLYTLKQPDETFPRVHEVMPIGLAQDQKSLNSMDVLAQAEKILQDKWEF
jgi:hypothetical protein